MCFYLHFRHSNFVLKKKKTPQIKSIREAPEYENDKPITLLLNRIIVKRNILRMASYRSMNNAMNTINAKITSRGIKITYSDGAFHNNYPKTSGPVTDKSGNTAYIGRIKNSDNITKTWLKKLGEGLARYLNSHYNLNIDIGKKKICVFPSSRNVYFPFFLPTNFTCQLPLKSERRIEGLPGRISIIHPQ